MPNPVLTRETKHIWYPCSQMKDYETFPPMIIKSAKGAYITLTNNHKIIDAISSWWCKILGHGHPRLKQALIRQANKFEHVIFANTTNEVILELSERLIQMTKTMGKVFYASEGSSAVEIAIKMSLHARKNTNELKRTKIMNLQNSYHGETGIALAVSDVGLYRKPYEDILPHSITLKHIPYVYSKLDPLWEDCGAIWPSVASQLKQNANSLSAIIIEPIIQGAGGMLLYSKDFLKRLRIWAIENNVHLIADEIMTGFGRTGLPFAFQHADIEPDFICIAKGLTGGWLPMSAVLTTDSIYDLFYADFTTGKAFLHSHTHSGNVLTAAVALECLKILQEEDVYAQVNTMEPYLYTAMQEVANKTKRLTNIRHIGAMVAADLILTKEQQAERYGYKVFKKAVELGALLRPLGNTIYWLPPLNTSPKVLRKLTAITTEAIKTAY